MRNFLTAMAAIISLIPRLVGAPPPNASVFEAAEIVSGTDIAYSTKSIAVGTVIVRVTVDSEGRIENTVGIRDIASLTAPCIDVVKEWRFEHAEFRGKPIPASVAVAFVLRLPPT